MKQWALRFKRSNHPAESGLIEASSEELAEAVGRKWCETESVGLLQPCRFISVSNPVLADESILLPPPTPALNIPEPEIAASTSLRERLQRAIS